MRAVRLFAFFLLPLSLAACTPPEHLPPVTLSVPSDSRVFHGEWIGEAASRELRAPIVVRATASYRSPTAYDITGTMSFRGVTYTLRGEGNGRDGATFRPQFSPAPPTGSFISWSANVLRDGVAVVGKLSGDGMGVRAEDPRVTRINAILNLDGTVWGLTVSRATTAPQP